MSAPSALTQIQQQIREAASHQRPIRIRGGGTKDFYGESLRGEVLDMGRLTGVIDYEPSELVVTAWAGTPLAEIEALLATQNQYLAFEPPAFAPGTTLGGVVAAGLSGPRRATVGGVRDFVLGASLLSSQGELLKFGGRVMKNVAGFDVSRLLVGSLGILGPIADVSIKVLPCPRLEVTLAFEMTAAESVRAFNRWLRTPIPVSATSWWGGQARVRLSGMPTAVEEGVRQLNGERVPTAEAAIWWAQLRHHQHPFLNREQPLWRMSIPATSPLLSIAGEVLIEWAGALRWVRSTTPASDLRAAASALGGSAALWHGGPSQPMSAPLAPGVLALHRRLKSQFDPLGIFNPDRLIVGI